MQIYFSFGNSSTYPIFQELSVGRLSHFLINSFKGGLEFPTYKMKRAKIFPFRSKYARQLGRNRVRKKKNKPRKYANTKS